ncbi:D-alanine--D-alanine ligase [Kingella negevensis]|uniref:D-alanine--D-alanine ligase n=1 Tax=Kingella negevensis TaxID=1522312 RepID=A0A238TDI6_9NEIS|nr:D-alanine--D-alanine ligase [Kingella negevensis]MDK4680201.1 D-alanine--D-alanine ligase [Kingella negevensis]MDK4682079.1 D-alanine--D-alanine ligase [Kingella negevensis]MDK4684518.1 D-alanine--D-alanine ligase [Kingella negevensis]MDK4690275.1 D-alanine--D-alanine ligase [Kingella negevensis]MDK4692379.1 D-alanine--D-alanine ligase [Kingella negevensis]
MQNFGKVAVLMGGFSSEREISLTSGNAILKALREKGVDAHAFDPKETPLSELKTQGFQAAFNILHGTYGEDGTVQGALEALGILYTGCGVLASALGMDKYRCKLIWAALGLPIPPFVVLHDDSDFAAVEALLGLPMFVKPAAEGSSVGVYKITQKGELAQVYQQLRDQNLHGEILAEQFMSGGEYTCGVFNQTALPTIRIIPKNDFYDWEAKYLRDDTVYMCPSDLSKADEALMRELAVKAFAAIGGGNTCGRVDFLKDADGKLYILEVNTLPGMTSHSLIPKAAKQMGIEFGDLCVSILQNAFNK